MAPKFGTSGLRGLVVELTDPLVARYTEAFLTRCESGGQLFVGRDLRSSSPRIAAAVIRAAQSVGVTVHDCGAVPTPALAVAAARAGGGAIMVTGSHIPDDRNGLKFYTVAGEITKADEAAIAEGYAQRGEGAPESGEIGSVKGAEDTVSEGFVARYLEAFPANALSGLRIGVYEHSTVVRDLFGRILRGLGAEVVPLGRSEVFVPVDTEAVSDETRAMLRNWAAEGGYDAIVSADGDGDRPMVADAQGAVVPGDTLGLLASKALGAEIAVVPVSCNTVLEMSGVLRRVDRTRIGSPFVIAGIEAVQAADPAARVVGFEANGGFLLGYPAALGGAQMTPLLTRDSVLPVIAALMASRKDGLAAACAALPPRYTAADRLQEVDIPKAQALIAAVAQDDAAQRDLLGQEVRVMDQTDGLRMTLPDETIVHLRLSGNAPELRCYAEAATEAAAVALVAQTLDQLAHRL